MVLHRPVALYVNSRLAEVLPQSLCYDLPMAIPPISLSTHVRRRSVSLQRRRRKLCQGGSPFWQRQQVQDAANLVAKLWTVTVRNAANSACVFEGPLLEVRKAAAAGNTSCWTV
eukprot:SRR837773.5675.p1 GENE.SRR837773.5675~~SRR837773.5675.p1  ORF type:complete len:114 (-),score=9.20 SRR837773.5675:112-453(-)